MRSWFGSGKSQSGKRGREKRRRVLRDWLAAVGAAGAKGAGRVDAKEGCREAPSDTQDRALACAADRAAAAA